MTIYRHGRSPFYHYSFRYRGKRFHGSTKKSNRREAEFVEKVERERARRLIEQTQVATTSLILDHVIARYWEQVGQHHAGADNTWRDLCRLIDYFGKDKLLTEIIDSDVSRLVAWRRGHRRAGTNELITPATVNRSTTEVLKKLFTAARTKWGVRFDHEPNWKTHILKEPQERVRELVGDEGDRLEAATREDLQPLFAFVRESGLRKRECISLRWSEVNWAAGQIVKLGKGSRRIVCPLTPTISGILEPLQGHHSEFVFTYRAQRTRNGRIKGRRYRLTLSGVNSAWKRLRKTAGVTDFRFHDFRHDFGTKLLRRTGNLKLVAKALNHADLTTTARYAHVLDAEVAEAMERLSQDRQAASQSQGTGYPRLRKVPQTPRKGTGTE